MKRKQAGRPPRAGGTARNRVVVLVDDGTLAAWRREADAAGVSMSEFVRRRCERTGCQ